MHRQSRGNGNAAQVAIAEVLGPDAIRAATNALGQGCDVTVFVNEPKKNKDGSIDIYFVPEPRKGWEKNWTQTNAGQSFFVYLRLYGPEQAYFNQSFEMNKIQRIK